MMTVLVELMIGTWYRNWWRWLWSCV